MDMFNFDNVKAEKVKALFQYNLLKTMQTLFRVTELLLLIILVSWTSFHLPFAVKISGEYFRLLISVLLNPFSIFLIGNIIVLCLLFKSRVFITAEKEDEIFQEFFTGNTLLNPLNGGDEMVVETEEVLYEDKETIYEENKTTGVSMVVTDINHNNEGRVQDLLFQENNKITRVSLVVTDINHNNEDRVRDFPYQENSNNNVEVLDPTLNEIVKVDVAGKNLVRSKSENLGRGVNISGKLRRSETEKCRGVLNLVEEEGEVHVFDELSNEEFQNAIETFIAKQMKFHKAEKHAIVLHSQT